MTEMMFMFIAIMFCFFLLWNFLGMNSLLILVENGVWANTIFKKDIILFKFNKQSNETLTQNSHDDIENIADTDTFVSNRMPGGPAPGPDS